MKRGRIPWLVSSALLLGATAAIAQPLPCASVSAEVREYVRNRGACSDAIAAPRPRSSRQSKSSASSSPTSAQQNGLVPDVIGRSFTEAARTLAKFKVERIETASAAPAGEVLAQEPAPAAAGRTGGTVILQVSDGSLAVATSKNPVRHPPLRLRPLPRRHPSLRLRPPPRRRPHRRPPFAASRADRFARSERSIFERILGQRCAHLRCRRFAWVDVRRTPDASAAVTRSADGWRKHAANASSTSAARRSAAGRIRHLRPLRDRRIV